MLALESLRVYGTKVGQTEEICFRAKFVGHNGQKRLLVLGHQITLVFSSWSKRGIARRNRARAILIERKIISKDNSLVNYFTVKEI